MKKKKWKHATERWLSERSGKKSIGTDRSMLFWIGSRWKDRLLEDVTAKSVRKLAEEKKAETSASTANRTLVLIKAMEEAGKLIGHPPLGRGVKGQIRPSFLTEGAA